MIKVNVFSEEKAWSKRLKNKNIFFRKICKAFPKKYQFLNKKVSLSLLLSNDKNIKRLNKNFRNKNKPTDILSFPLSKKIIISMVVTPNQTRTGSPNHLKTMPVAAIRMRRARLPATTGRPTPDGCGRSV